MPVLVAAAGNMLGGYTASLLMGDTSYPEGGGIEGLTTSDPGKSGIMPAVQIDSKPALEYFQKAAKQQTEQYQKGLDYYDQKTQLASSQLTAAIQQANTTLGKLAYTGEVSTDRYLQMLGINARSPSYASPDEVGALGSQYNDFAQRMRQAEKIEDPKERETVKSGILWAVNKANENQIALLNANKKAAMDALGPRPDRAAIIAADPGAQSLRRGLIDGKFDGVITSIADGDNNPLAQRLNAPIKAYDKKYNETLAHWDKQIADFTAKSSSAVANYDKNYQSDADYFGYDPKERQKIIDEDNPALTEIRNRLIGGKVDIGKPTAETLPNTPGYKFSLKQGQDSVLAAAAAGGMLSSGNTLAAMDKYSQGLAQQIYAQEMGFYLEGAKINTAIEGAASDIAANQYASYMGNLTNAMSLGTQGTMQVAANQADLGAGLASLTQALGNVGAQTYQGIGDALAQSLYKQGETYNSNNLANMSAQNEMIKMGAGLASQNAIQGGYLQLANNQFNAQQSNLAGRAAGINAGAGRGGNGGWPMYMPGAGGTAGRWTLG